MAEEAEDPHIATRRAPAPGAPGTAGGAQDALSGPGKAVDRPEPPAGRGGGANNCTSEPCASIPIPGWGIERSGHRGSCVHVSAWAPRKPIGPERRARGHGCGAVGAQGRRARVTRPGGPSGPQEPGSAKEQGPIGAGAFATRAMVSLALAALLRVFETGVVASKPWLSAAGRTLIWRLLILSWPKMASGDGAD